jgi:hypothetical protein
MSGERAGERSFTIREVKGSSSGPEPPFVSNKRALILYWGAQIKEMHRSILNYVNI